MTIKQQAMVRSLKLPDEVEIIEHIDNNHCKARYKGKTCTAIFNPFTCCYYVDDIDGVIEDENITREGE